MRTRQNDQRGFSLIEMIVVVLIVGIMSLITVPQFVSYQQSAKLKSAMGNFNADLRSARQLAITRYWQVRVEFPSSTTYAFYYRSGNSGTWTELTNTKLKSARINGLSGNIKTLPAPLTFVQGPFTVAGVDYPAFNDLSSPANALPDVVFNTDGSVVLDSAGTQTSGSVEISSPWTNVANNQMVITVYPSGRVTSLAKHS